MNRVLIFVDNREVSSGILDYFRQYDCEIQTKMLLYGDFIASDRVCIEKKVVSDFIKSITDQRLFQQLKGMKDNFEKPVLIIEGEESLYGMLQPNVIRGALAAIAVDLAIPIIWTRDMADTAGIIYWIAKREQLLEKREIVLRNKKVPETIEEMQEYLISSLPDVSSVRAKALLEHFKTPQGIFNASEEELQEVKGIGKVIAKKIKKVLENEHK
jgi:Fanconi anemia group M protein